MKENKNNFHSIHPDRSRPWVQYGGILLKVIVIACISASIAGCAVNRAVSPKFTKLVEDMPFKADHPIAREIGITYSFIQELDGKMCNPAICSNEKNQSTKQKKSTDTPWYNMPQPTSTTKWSEIYNQKATDARFRGNFGDARFYSQSAANSLEVEIAMENMVNNVNTAFATYSATVEALNQLRLPVDLYGKINFRESTF